MKLLAKIVDFLRFLQIVSFFVYITSFIFEKFILYQAFFILSFEKHVVFYLFVADKELVFVRYLAAYMRGFAFCFHRVMERTVHRGVIGGHLHALEHALEHDLEHGGRVNVEIRSISDKAHVHVAGEVLYVLDRSLLQVFLLTRLVVCGTLMVLYFDDGAGSIC